MDSELDIPVTPELSTGTPSITIKGSFVALSDEPPRIRISAAPSGLPPLRVTTTPGVFPTNKSCAEVAKPAFISSGFTKVTDPVASLLRTVP